MREHLPDTRHSITHKFKIYSDSGVVKGFLTVGFYPDGRPAELFITVDTVDAAFRCMSNGFACMVSLCLQHGVPVADIIRKFRAWRSEPCGVTDHPSIHVAQSLPDYIARFLETLTSQPAPVVTSAMPQARKNASGCPGGLINPTKEE